MVRHPLTGLLSLLLVLTAVAAGGCAASQEAAVAGETTLEVENDNFYDVNVYVEREGQRFRLGTVTGKTTQMFALPESASLAAARMRVLYRAIGPGESAATEELIVDPGDALYVLIPAF